MPIKKHVKQWAAIFSPGSNDNLVLLWDPRRPETPVYTLTAHLAAVKAVAWCPWQPKTLATGGGTTDRTIKFWNTASGNMLQSVNTGSQVEHSSLLLKQTI
jgi:WD40 repeat protein